MMANELGMGKFMLMHVARANEKTIMRVEDATRSVLGEYLC
jgi:hypothetical protein